MSFGIISHSGFCRSGLCPIRDYVNRDYVVRDYVAFGIISFGIICPIQNYAAYGIFHRSDCVVHVAQHTVICDNVIWLNVGVQYL